MAAWIPLILELEPEAIVLVEALVKHLHKTKLVVPVLPLDPSPTLPPQPSKDPQGGGQ